MNVEFVRQIFENPQISNLMTIRPGEGGGVASYGQTDGRTATWKSKIYFYKFNVVLTVHRR